MMHARFNTLAAVVMAASLLVPPNAAAVADDRGNSQVRKHAAPPPMWAHGSIDHGAAAGADPALKGLTTPNGFKLEIIAREPEVIEPISLTFGDDGTPYVIEWKKPLEGGDGSPAGTVVGENYELTYKDGSKRTLHRFTKRGPTIEGRPASADWLKALMDKDGDGIYDGHALVIDDLQMPSTCLIHDGWFYFTTQGSVIRRRQSEPGGKFDVTETIARGLPGFGRHQASGLTISHDGWLFITAGDDDSHAEGSDGSRVNLYRNGGIYMCRPDGSKLRLYARGFSNPYGNLAFDDHQNLFHVDGASVDPVTTASANWRGTRLIHVQEDADYGWRLAPGFRCCVPDDERAAVSGEVPGKSPVMMKTKTGAPAGLLFFTGHAMPEAFRGWLIQPDPVRRSVTALRVQRGTSAQGSSTFEVVEQFEIFKSEDANFRPSQAVQGPDGALYIVDSRSDFTGPLTFHGEGRAGRIYRLTWSGTKEHPAIAPGPMNAWAKVGAMSNVQLWLELNTTDLAMQQRVVNELVRRGTRNKDTFIAVAKDERRPAHARIAALGAVCRMAGAEEIAALADAVSSDAAADVRRVASKTMTRSSPRTPPVKREPSDERPEGVKASKHEKCRALADAMLDAKKPLEERRAALKAMSSIRAVDHFAAIQPVEQGVERMAEELAQLVADPTAAELRGDALKLLMEVDAKRAEALVIRVLNSGEAASVKTAMEMLSGTSAGTVALGEWFAAGKLDRALLPEVVGALQKHAEAQAKAAGGKQDGQTLALLVKVYGAGLLAERDEDSLKQLEVMVKAQGDAARGKAIFLGGRGARCVVCHRIDTVGDRDLPKEAAGRIPLGPGLSRTRRTLPIASLIDAILEPSSEVKEGFRGWTATTSDGQAITGIKVEENDKSVTIRDAQTGKDLLILRLAIESLKERKESLMPGDFALRLSYEEMMDLLAFLRE